MERAERLFKEKCWRFQIGAMERFRKEDGYVARHLVDTQYLSRLAKRSSRAFQKPISLFQRTIPSTGRSSVASIVNAVPIRLGAAIGESIVLHVVEWLDSQDRAS